MAKSKSIPATVRVLPRSEYPTSLTASRGAYRPDVAFVAVHPLGTYHIERHGMSGHYDAYFTAKRKGSRMKIIGGASSMEGAFRRIQQHEDELMEPNAAREEGKNGPVNIFDLGKRTGGTKKTKTQLDAEIEAILAQGN